MKDLRYEPKKSQGRLIGSMLLIVFGFLFLLVFALFMARMASAEETKVISGKNLEVKITVPEKAPEFLNWDGFIVGGESYINGNSLFLVSLISPDERTTVSVLIGGIKGKNYILAFAVFYDERPNDPPDMYEDLGFMKTGKPTGILEKVTEPDSINAFRALMEKTEI